MATDSRNLNIMLFPQSWNGGQIVANLLLLPAGDPTAPVADPPPSASSELPFGQARPVLRAAYLPGFAKPSWDPGIGPSIIHSPLYHVTPPSTTLVSGLVQPPFKAQIWNDLNEQFAPKVIAGRSATKGTVKKDLPPSYLEAAGFSVTDPSLFSSGNGYSCDLQNTPPNTTPITSGGSMQWGEVISYSIRQPLAAQALGLSYTNVYIEIDSALAATGGWLWVEIDTTNPANWYSQLVTLSAGAAPNQQPVRSYAARIPPLTLERSLFSAVLFPTQSSALKTGSSVLDDAQNEADSYTDGFATVVHASQPEYADAITGTDTSMVPGTDAGFQIGWDDVQITTWLQRQVQTANDLANNSPTGADEFPLGVQGYRVDARIVPDGTADPTSATPPWNSLVTVQASLTAGDAYSTNQVEELWIEPTPVGNGAAPTNYWMPRYFAQWRGQSLVVDDPYAFTFGMGGTPPAYPQNPGAPQFNGSLQQVLNIGLRYGDWYQLRTRMADLTGGGPDVTDGSPDAGVATLPFLRYVPPKAVSVTTTGPANAPATITVGRPQLNYPEMVFAGAATQADLDSFLTTLQGELPAYNAAVQANQWPLPALTPVEKPDPDVKTLEVFLEAKAPAHDTGTAASMKDMETPPQPDDLDGPYRVVYRVEIPFTGDSVTLTLTPADVTSIRLLSNPSSGTTTLIVPNGRNLRLRMRGLGDGDPNYWGSTVASTGLVSDLFLRYESSAEPNPIVDATTGPLSQQLEAIYLQEDPTVAQQAVVASTVSQALASSSLATGLQQSLALAFQTSTPTPLQQLAEALNLNVNEQTLTPQPGQRVLFGAQSTIRHSLTQDLSAITFSSQKDLIGHWIVAIRLKIDRDWTWSGLAQNGAGQTGFVFSGASVVGSGPMTAISEVGRVTLPGVVSALSTQPTGSTDQRDTTEIIFFATLDTTVPPGEFPDVTHSQWSLGATFTGAPATTVPLWMGAMDVPITLPPQQTPTLVSAGLAESKYVEGPNYAFTEQRQRYLWVEFDGPPADKHDSYFFRILSYGPDPLLVSFPQDLPAATEPPLPIDPEWIRVIAAGDTNDDAGLGAMSELTPSLVPSGMKPVHYLVPLPQSIPPEALELFGFWIVELRVGHLLWSTAQARYGRPLRVSGIQYPPPPLSVNVDRRFLPAVSNLSKLAIVATADLAQTVMNGVSLTLPARPQTEIWFLLYAQVRRVDGKAYRNILLARKPGKQAERTDNKKLLQNPGDGLFFTDGHSGKGKNIPVTAVFLQNELALALEQLQLPPATPTSVLAVELFNGEADVIPPSTDQPATPKAVADPDPLGLELGNRRILRVSPLIQVSAICG